MIEKFELSLWQLEFVGCQWIDGSQPCAKIIFRRSTSSSSNDQMFMTVTKGFSFVFEPRGNGLDPRRHLL